MIDILLNMFKAEYQKPRVGTLCNFPIGQPTKKDMLKSEGLIEIIEQRTLPAVTVLPYDISIAKVFGSIQAHLEDTGMILPNADIQVATTAVGHNLDLVTDNICHFNWISGLKLDFVLANSRNL